jgi:serine/threonine protein kinase
MLRMFSGNHPHLASLLVTYTQFHKFHLVFYAAEADLLEYWRQVNPSPPMTLDTISWVAKQCQGLADGLAKIHRFETAPSQTNKFTTFFGRHGDIKPENILWFRDPNSPRGGTLQITDFGHAESSIFQTKIRKPGSKAAFSPSYRPPECDIPGGLISASSDIWTLGCLYLEFVSWLLGGWKLVHEFQTRRLLVDPLYSNMRTDTFFQVEKVPDTGNLKVLIKPAVTSVSKPTTNLIFSCLCGFPNSLLSNSIRTNHVLSIFTIYWRLFSRKCSLLKPMIPATRLELTVQSLARSCWFC